MVKGWDYMRGMPPGGTLVINTHYTPEYMIRFVPKPERLAPPVCVDAAKLADHKGLYYPLREAGVDMPSTPRRPGPRKARTAANAAPPDPARLKNQGRMTPAAIQALI